MSVCNCFQVHPRLNGQRLAPPVAEEDHVVGRYHVLQIHKSRVPVRGYLGASQLWAIKVLAREPVLSSLEPLSRNGTAGLLGWAAA